MKKDLFTIDEETTGMKHETTKEPDYIKLGMLLVAGLAVAGKTIAAGYHLCVSKDSMSLDPHEDEDS